MAYPHPQPWSRLRVYPLAERESLTEADQILVDPDAEPPPLSPGLERQVALCAQRIRDAHSRSAGVILMYGAHLLRNGAARILDRMMARGWLTHVATNGAGTIHDWEYAWLGRSTESVEKYVARGQFGAWDETGTYLHLSLAAGALCGYGYGQSLGRFIHEDGCQIPLLTELLDDIAADPGDIRNGSRCSLYHFLSQREIPAGWFACVHRFKHASILAAAVRHGVPATVHPGIGYDIISNHPLFDGAVIGRAAGIDFRLFGDSVATLGGGVLLSVGSAIMAPQVFEKSLSCVNNLRLQEGRNVVQDLTIQVVDLQDGGGWDWSTGEPPKTNPAYYLRFCKSFSRMGGEMHYAQCDNLAFMHHLCRQLG
jgi:hypothetical protein